MRRRWAVAVAVGCALVGITTVDAHGLGRPHAGAHAAGCASLGQAAGFVAFSNGDFVASPPGGENITGRIAAAGGVTLGVRAAAACSSCRQAETRRPR